MMHWLTAATRHGFVGLLVWLGLVCGCTEPIHTWVEDTFEDFQLKDTIHIYNVCKSVFETFFVGHNITIIIIITIFITLCNFNDI